MLFITAGVSALWCCHPNTVCKSYNSSKQGCCHGNIYNTIVDQDRFACCNGKTI